MTESPSSFSLLSFLPVLEEKDRRILLLEIELERAKEREIQLKERLMSALQKRSQFRLLASERRRKEMDLTLSNLLLKGEISYPEYEHHLKSFDRNEFQKEEEEAYEFLEELHESSH